MPEEYGPLKLLVPKEKGDGVDVPRDFKKFADTVAKPPTAAKSQIAIVQSDGSIVYKTIKGDAAVAEDGTLTAVRDEAAATPSMRTLGTGAKQAAAGNDSRLSDERTPLDGSATSRKTKLTAGVKPATESLALTGSYQDVVGAALEITPAVPSLLIVSASFDFSFTGVGAKLDCSGVGSIKVDSEAEDANFAFCRGALQNTEATPRFGTTIPGAWVVPLTAAKHTVKLRAKAVLSTGTGSVLFEGTKLSYILIAS